MGVFFDGERRLGGCGAAAGFGGASHWRSSSRVWSCSVIDHACGGGAISACRPCDFSVPGLWIRCFTASYAAVSFSLIASKSAPPTSLKGLLTPPTLT